ncbi:MAG TPA: type VI secretion system ImpA family N-terminal domain-containing protein [Methylocella sp.]
MAALSLEALTAPVSAANPCGQDLDLAGDSNYMNFMAAAEGLLPRTFYYPDDDGDPSLRNKPFDRTTVDFASQYEIMAGLIRRSCDLRLVVLLAKFRILDRDLTGFVQAVEALALLLEQHWETVHPRGGGGDFTVRVAIVQSLDDMVPVILPLHYVPFFAHRHAGPVSYRSHLLAEGEAAPRGDEDKLDLALIKRAFADVELATLIERRDQFKRLGTALARINAIFVKNIGQAEAVAFQKLAPLAEKIRALLDAHVVTRDPSAGETDASAGADGGTDGETQAIAQVGDIKSFADAAAALAAIATYFVRFEPSNPALLLVRQAEQLIGKSFLEAIRLLVPSHAETAAVQIGRAQGFNLPLERLSEFASPEVDTEAPAASETIFTVTTRDGALQLLAKVGAFYQRAEPSSPVSFLTERARTLTGRDFLGLLKDMLPPDALKTLDGK